MTQADLITRLARFARTLRERGMRVTINDELDAMLALSLVDATDRSEVRLALRTALKIQRRDWEAFDELLGPFWAGTDAAPIAREPPRQQIPERGGPLGKLLHGPEESLSEPKAVAGAAEGNLPGYSPEVLLRRKPFEECAASDLAAMEKLLYRLVRKLGARHSRRLVPTRGRGAVDLRRSFRRAIGTGGEFLALARRARALEEPRLVVICDTSGSMESHTRFLLAFVLALKRVARQTEIFAFNTALTRLTPWLSSGKIGSTLQRLAAGVPDWSGGTRIGESLAEFVSSYQALLVNAKTTVLIFSDGLDRGDTTLLSAAMRAIQSRARQVIWLNPLLGDPRYRPTARGMEAALPYVDHLAPAHNLESLEKLIPLLAA
ncbi:MAG TPA: VWA domain-containing protein [Myxococcaceae bacterium]|nr:VWA domain-containing protein [Myxococcaceae bacterium]